MRMDLPFFSNFAICISECRLLFIKLVDSKINDMITYESIVDVIFFGNTGQNTHVQFS